MKTLIQILIITSFFSSCIPSFRVISGKVTDRQGNIVTVNNIHKFEVFDTTGIFIGKEVTFTATKKKEIVNSKKIQ